MNPKKRIGEMLLEAGIIDETQLKAALGHQRQWGVRLGQALVDLKLATESDIVRALSLKFGFEVANLGALEPYGHEQAVKLLPREFAVRNNVFPMWADTANVTVAMSDPTNLAIVDEIRFRTGRRVKVCIGGDHEVADAVRRRYGGEDPVEAIALDLEADPAVVGESVFDPFGGSGDAFDPFFGDPAGGLGGAPATAPTRAAPQPAGGATRTVTASSVSHAVRNAGATLAASGGAPTTAGSAPPRAAVPAAPSPQDGALRGRAGPAPATRAASPSWAQPARSPTQASRSAPPRTLELELEEHPARAAPAGGTPADDVAEELTPLEDVPPGEPILASELAPQEQAGDGAPESRGLSPREVAILDSLDRLADGAPAEPDIVKPVQAMAAMIRLLIRKRIVSEQEFLDELSKK